MKNSSFQFAEFFDKKKSQILISRIWDFPSKICWVTLYQGENAQVSWLINLQRRDKTLVP